jgi:hypothetical protein
MQTSWRFRVSALLGLATLLFAAVALVLILGGPWGHHRRLEEGPPSPGQGPEAGYRQEEPRTTSPFRTPGEERRAASGRKLERREAHRSLRLATWRQ